MSYLRLGSNLSKATGVDLSKILGGQTKILGEKVVKSDKCMGVSQLLGEHVPGLPPKSTPMVSSIFRFKSLLSNSSIRLTLLSKPTESMMI